MHFQLVLTALSVILTVAKAAPQQYTDCVIGQPITEIYVQSYVVGYPVLLNTLVLANTIINIGGITINVDNAPTQISTILNATSTTTVTSTVISTAFTSLATATTSPQFLLQISPAVVARRRQIPANPSFITSTGGVTEDCVGGAIFKIQDGRLGSGTWTMEADASAGSLPFMSANGNVSTWFSTNNNILVWASPQFTSGNAMFCLLNGMVRSVFNQVPPAQCTPIQLIPVPEGSCLGDNSSSSNSTVSSSPFGSTISSGGSASGVGGSGAGVSGAGGSGVGASGVGASGVGASAALTAPPSFTTSFTSAGNGFFTAITQVDPIHGSSIAASATSDDFFTAITQIDPIHGSAAPSTTSSSLPIATPICDTTTTALDVGTNTCICLSGFTTAGTSGDGLSCAPIPDCDTTTTAYDTGTNTCTCLSGFSKVGAPDDGLSCVPNPVCDTASTALDAGTNTCTCLSGFSTVGAPTDGLSCVPNPDCDTTSTALDVGSNTCTCLSGFSTVGAPTDGLSCVPNPDCDTTSTALDAGTNTCTCLSGFSTVGAPADGLSCVPNPDCDTTSTVLDVGSNTCTCLSGFTTVGQSSPLSCTPNANCDTTSTSLDTTTNTCTCLPGFTTTGQSSSLSCAAIPPCDGITATLDTTTNTCVCVADNTSAGTTPVNGVITCTCNLGWKPARTTSLTCVPIVLCVDVVNPYITPNGDEFTSNCGTVYGTSYVGVGQNVISWGAQPDIESCFDQCSTTDGCIAVDFGADYIPPLCALLSSTPYGTVIGSDSGYLSSPAPGP